MVDVSLRILERIIRGMTFEFAITRFFELEEKKQFYLNRIRMNSFLKSLLKGLQSILVERMLTIDPTLKIPLEDVAKFDMTKIVDFEREENYTEKFKEMMEMYGDNNSSEY